MDTVPTLRPTIDDTRPAPRARLELTWTLQHTRGQAEVPTLAGRWIVIEPDAMYQAAA